VHLPKNPMPKMLAHSAIKKGAAIVFNSETDTLGGDAIKRRYRQWL
jgi:hypothetical protein